MSKLLTLSFSKSTLYICNLLDVKTAVPILALHNTNLLYSISIDHLSHYLPNKKNIPVNTPSPKNKVQNMVQQPTFLPLNPSLQGPDIGAKVKGPNIAIAINAWTSNDVHQVIFHHGLMSIPDHPGFWRFQKWRQELWCFFWGGRGGCSGFCCRSVEKCGSDNLYKSLSLMWTQHLNVDTPALYMSDFPSRTA